MPGDPGPPVLHPFQPGLDAKNPKENQLRPQELTAEGQAVVLDGDSKVTRQLRSTGSSQGFRDPPWQRFMVLRPWLSPWLPHSTLTIHAILRNALVIPCPPLLWSCLILWTGLVGGSLHALFPVTQPATKQATNVHSHPGQGPVPPHRREPTSSFQHQLHRVVWGLGPASLTIYNPQTCGLPQPSHSAPFHLNPLLLAFCSHPFQLPELSTGP